MGRVFFFISEGLRALRRSAAPSLAAIVTVTVTGLLLGVLIPVLQTTGGKTEEVRDQVGLRVFLTTETPYTQQDVDSLETSLQGIPHVKEVEFVSKDEGLKLLRAVCERRQVVGVDVVELCPIPGQIVSEFFAAKLVHKIIGYLGLSPDGPARGGRGRP